MRHAIVLNGSGDSNRVEAHRAGDENKRARTFPYLVRMVSTSGSSVGEKQIHHDEGTSTPSVVHIAAHTETQTSVVLSNSVSSAS